MPLSPAFYQKPKNIKELEDFIVGNLGAVGVQLISDMLAKVDRESGKIDVDSVPLFMPTFSFDEEIRSKWATEDAVSGNVGEIFEDDAGNLYDEYGNPIEISGVKGNDNNGEVGEVVQDEYGNYYLVEGEGKGELPPIENESTSVDPGSLVSGDNLGIDPQEILKS